MAVPKLPVLLPDQHDVDLSSRFDVLSSRLGASERGDQMTAVEPPA